MTAVFDSPAVLQSRDKIQSAFHPEPGILPRNNGTVVRDLPETFHHGIRTANSWRDLEEWLSQAEGAYQLGELDADQIETLVCTAVQVSRGIPEK